MTTEDKITEAQAYVDSFSDFEDFDDELYDPVRLPLFKSNVRKLGVKLSKTPLADVTKGGVGGVEGLTITLRRLAQNLQEITLRVEEEG